MNQPILGGDRQIPPGGGQTPQPSTALRAASARLRAARIERERHFPPELASGQAWHLLLDLHGDHETPATGNSSPATRDRWLRVLAENGLVRLRDDGPTDAILTDEGLARIDGYLSACLARGLI